MKYCKHQVNAILKSKQIKKSILFSEALIEYAVAAVDGKVLRGSANSNNNAVSVLSAVLAETKLIIAHKEIAKKSNEIPAFQELIGELDETFSYGFDALNTQKNSKEGV